MPIDASARAAHKGIANATSIKYDGEPHGLIATAKERVSKDLVQFLTGALSVASRRIAALAARRLPSTRTFHRPGVPT